MLDELSVQLNPEMVESLTMIKRNWKLLLHTVKKTIQTSDHNDNPLFVEVEKQEVDWKPLLQLYIEKYGKDSEKEAERRRARGAAGEAEQRQTAEVVHADNDSEESDEQSDEQSGEEEDQEDDNDGEQPHKRHPAEPANSRQEKAG